jgi:hypothetical protein
VRLQASRHAGQLREVYRASLRELKLLKETSGVAAGVYTQTTDVEGEVNGLLTYDRKVRVMRKQKEFNSHICFLKENFKSKQIFFAPGSEYF